MVIRGGAYGGNKGMVIRGGAYHGNKGRGLWWK